MTFSPGWHWQRLTIRSLAAFPVRILLLRTWGREFLLPHLYPQHFFSIVKAGVWTWNEISLFLTIYCLQILLVLCALFNLYITPKSLYSDPYTSAILFMNMTDLPSFFSSFFSFLHPQAVSPSYSFLSASFLYLCPISAGMLSCLAVVLYLPFPPSLMYFLCGVPHFFLLLILSSLCWWLLNLLCPKPTPLGSSSCLWYFLTDILLLPHIISSLCTSHSPILSTVHISCSLDLLHPPYQVSTLPETAP